LRGLAGAKSLVHDNARSFDASNIFR